MRKLLLLVSILSCSALGIGSIDQTETCYQYSVTYDGDGSTSTQQSSDYANLQLYSDNKNFAVRGVEMQTTKDVGQIASLRFVYQANATTVIPSVTHGRQNTFQDTVNATYTDSLLYTYSSYWLGSNLNLTKLQFFENNESGFVGGLQFTLSNGTEILSSPRISEMKAIYQNNGNQPESSVTSPIYGLNTSLSWEETDPNIYLDRSVEILLDQSDTGPNNFCFTVTETSTTSSSSASVGAMILLILIAVISLIMIVGIVIIFVYLSKDRKKRLEEGTFEIEDDGVITIKISYAELKRKQDEARIRKAKKRGLKQINITKGKQNKQEQRQLSTILEESSYQGTSDDALTLNMETTSDMSSFNYNDRSELNGHLLIKTQISTSLQDQDNLAQADQLSGNGQQARKNRSTYKKQSSARSTNSSVQFDDNQSQQL